MAETLANHTSGAGVVSSTAGDSRVIGVAGVERNSSCGGVVMKTSCWVLKEQPGPRLVGFLLPGVPPCGGVVVSGRCHLLPNCFRDPVVFVGCGWWVWVVGGVLFENCTVDASIFVVKFVRANGGCLGTRSR